MDLEKYGKFLSDGKIDEDNAMKIIETTIGGKCYPVSKDIDITCHTDFLWESPKGYLCSVDKKMQKKLSRGDDNKSNTMTWIELVNNSGLPGSATCQVENLAKYNITVSEAHDYLMLETNIDYLFLQRKKLTDFLYDKVDMGKVVYENPRKPYIPYQRKKYGHKDINVLTPNEDLEKIAHFTITKTNEI